MSTAVRRSVFHATKLVNKKIVRVTGAHTYPYVQTLLTNDLRHLLQYRDDAPTCIYSFIINSMGRSLADVFVYKPQRVNISNNYRSLALAPYHVESFGHGGNAHDELLIECQASLAKPLAQALLAHKIRRQVSVEVANEFDLWSLRPDSLEDLRPLSEIRSSDFTLTRDPRLPYLGYRLITTLGAKTSNDLSRFFTHRQVDLKHSSLSDYEKFRYKLGIGEGEKDHPGHFAIPLEANADLLNGLSFRKGLFCGNDITARNYRKGIKKRLFPVEFIDRQQPDQAQKQTKLEIWPNTELIMSGERSAVGRLMSVNGTFGLAYMNINVLRKYTNVLKLYHPQSGMTVEAKVPFWWRRTGAPQIPDGKLANQEFIEENVRLASN